MRQCTLTTCAAVVLLLLGMMLLLSCGSSTTSAPTQPSAAKSEPPKTDAHEADPASEESHWDYSKEKGPATWGKLSPEYILCAEGKSQSPIDFSITSPADTADFTANYSPQELRIVHHEHKSDVINTGHSIQVNYGGSDTLVMGGTTYALVQFHFHLPSEHTINGKHFPMEVHFVHQSADNKLAVVGLFVEEGAHNAVFDAVLANLPREKGKEMHFTSVLVDVDELLPVNRSTYRYTGSLTTPPCSEGVTWTVFTNPTHVSAKQIAALRDLLHDNNRPAQPLNGRIVGRTDIKETIVK